MFENKLQHESRSLFQIAVWTAVFLLSSCGHSSRHALGPNSNEVARVTLQGDVITYRGLIDSDSVKQVEDLLLRNPAVKTVSITSAGGDVTVGMRFGNLIKAHSLDVEVIGNICASSCANYVFLSGAKKTIAPGAVVFWHGSPLRPEFDSVTETFIDAAGKSETIALEGKSLEAFHRRPEVVARNARDRNEQLAFFRARDMDGRVTTFGHEVGCRCNWSLSVDDMAAFGIRNVHAPDGYPESADWWDVNRLIELTLSDYPDYLASLKD